MTGATAPAHYSQDYSQDQTSSRFAAQAPNSASVSGRCMCSQEVFSSVVMAGNIR